MTYEPGQTVVYWQLTRRALKPVECTVVRVEEDPSWIVIRKPTCANPIRVKRTSINPCEKRART